MSRKEYEDLLVPLQIELIKLQRYIFATRKKLVILFEGRDGAGKGGTILRVSQHLNPRIARVIALAKPSDAEKSQWYFQRYVAHLPSAGEIVFFDRSWYNRAGVERVMGFCTDAQYQEFMSGVPFFEAMLQQADIHLLKVWLDISKKEQKERLTARKSDPLKQWKLSDLDRFAQKKWDEYAEAKYEMFRRTSSPTAPWTVVKSDDKQVARVNAIRIVLSQFDYEGKDARIAVPPDPRVVGPASDPYFFE